MDIILENVPVKSEEGFDCIADLEAKLEYKCTIERWHQDISKRINLSTQRDDEKLVDEMMLTYNNNNSLLKEKNIRYKDKAVLKSKLLLHIRHFYLYYKAVGDAVIDTNYFTRMEDILVYYCNLELDLVYSLSKQRENKKYNLFVIKRLCKVLGIYLHHKLRYIIHVLLKMKYKYSLACQTVMRRVYCHFLMTTPSEPLSDEVFCRYYLAFERYKQIAKPEERKMLKEFVFKKFDKTKDFLERNPIMKTVLSSCKSVPEALTHLLDCMAPAIQAYFEYLKNQDNEKARLIANFDTSYGHDGFFNTFYNYPTSPLSENHTSDSGLDIKEEKEGVLVIEVEDDMVMTYKARPPATKSKKKAEIDTVILVSDEDSLPSSSSGISVCTAMTTESCDNRAPSTLTLSTLSTSPALSETSSINGPTFEDNTSLQSPPSLHSPDKEHNNFSGEIVTDCTLTDQTNKIFPEENNGFSKALTANLPTSKVETSPLFGIIAPCQDVERTQSISENTMLSMLNLKLDEDNNSQSTSNQNSEIPLAIDAASLFDSRQTETPTDTSDETNMDSMAILENSQKECDVPSRQESEMAFDISANPITDSNTTCVSKNEVSVTLPKSCASPISLMPSSTLQNFMSDAKASTSYTLSAITDTVSESTQNRYGEKSTFTSASLAVESSYPELNTNLPDDVETTSQDTLPSTDTISSSFNGSIAHSICMFKNPTFGEELTTISIKPISTMSHLTSTNSSTCTDEPKIESAAMSQCGEDLINISAMPLLKTQKQSNTLVPNSKVRQAKTKSNTIRKLGVITPSTRSDENPLHLKDFGKHPKERSVPERECSFNNYLTTCGNKYFSSEESSINNGLYSENSTIYSDMDTQLSEEGGAIDFDNYTDPEQDNVTSISEVDVKETIVLPPPATLDFNGHNDEDQYYYYKSNTEICTECDECQIEKEYGTFNNSRTTFTDISKKKSANSKKRDRIKRKSRNKKRSEREYPNRLNKGEKYKPQKVLYTSDAMVDYLKTDMNVDKEFDGVMSGPVSDRNFPFCSSFDSAPEETSDTESPAYNKIDPTDLKNYMRDEFIFDKNHDVISDSKSIPKKSSVTFSDVVDTRYISSNNSKSKDKKHNGDYIIRDGIKCYVDPTDRKLNEELQLVVRKLTPSDIANILLDLANKSMTGNHNTMKTCIRKKIDCSLTENYAAATMNDIRIKGSSSYGDLHENIHSTYIQGHRIIVDGYIPPHRRRGRPRKRPMEEEYTSRKKRR